jgi:hypothetical protein
MRQKACENEGDTTSPKNVGQKLEGLTWLQRLKNSSHPVTGNNHVSIQYIGTTSGNYRTKSSSRTELTLTVSIDPTCT